MRRPILAAAVALAAAPALAQSPPLPSPDGAAHWRAAVVQPYDHSRAPRITRRHFDEVRLGMDWARVVAIVGGRGHAVVSGANTDRTTMTWGWVNPDGSGMTCVFRDGKLVEKRQNGLEPAR